ncbi:hypothetical protein E1H18_4706 [Caulobacter sp. RHG1]|nr:hypothetical protein [Caulobacter sp. RHG1]
MRSGDDSNPDNGRDDRTGDPEGAWPACDIEAPAQTRKIVSGSCVTAKPDPGS